MNASVALAIFLIIGLTTVIVVVPVTAPTATLNPVTPAPGTNGFGTLNTPEHTYLQSVCTCTGNTNVPASDERTISNMYLAQSEPIPDERNLNLLAVIWGQLIDHETVLTETDTMLPTDIITMNPFDDVNLTLTRVQRRQNQQHMCLEPHNFLTGAIDGSAIYGDLKSPTKINELRVPASCYLVEGPNGLVKYQGGQFICGDKRCGEHPTLTILHSLLVREHNRWCGILPGR